MQKKAVIFGAGQIGRGFLGQVLFHSGYQLIFIDVSQKLVDLLNQYKEYQTIVVGAEEKSYSMSGIPEFRLDRDAVRRDISKLTEAGLEIRLNQRIGKFHLNKIQEEFDVVILAAGQPNGKLLKIPGHMNDAILTAMQFMH